MTFASRPRHVPTRGSSTTRTCRTGSSRWELGVDGKSVKVVRTVRDAAGKTLFRETYVSVYDPRDWIKRIGTGT